MSTADTLIALIDAASVALHRIVDEKDEADEFSLTFLTLSDLRHGVSELGRLEGELAEVRAELKATRAQRDAAERALHKANHDGDELRQRLPNTDVSWITSPRTVHRISKQLVDGGEGDNYWID